MLYYNDYSLIRRLSGKCDGGHYEQNHNNKTTTPILLKFTLSDSLLIKLLELGR